MAVAYVSISTVSGASGGWTTGTSVTPGAGTNRIMVVLTNCYPGNVGNISTLTFKGNSCTFVRRDVILGEARTEAWWITENTADFSSAGTLVITPASGTPTVEEQAFVLTFSGAHQTAPIKSSAGIAAATGTGGTESTTISSNSDGYVAASITTFSTTAIAATSPGAERGEVQNASNLMDSECQTSPGTGSDVTVAWSGMNNASDRAASIVSLVAAAAAVVDRPRCIMGMAA